MVDLKLEVPATDEIEVDAETLAILDRRVADAEGGRTFGIEEVRQVIPQWLSAFGSQKPR